MSVPPPQDSRRTSRAFSIPRAPDKGPSHLARLVSLIVSAGLAWAIAVGVLAWIFGRLLS